MVVGQEGTPNILLMVERDESLTLYIAASEPVSLIGLSFRVVNSLGRFQTFKIEEGFASLRLTGGIAQPGSCFVYTQAGKSPVLTSICSTPNRVFRIEVPRADVFWYDFTTNRQRDIAIVADDTPTGDICTAVLVECAFTYLALILPTPTFSTTSACSDSIVSNAVTRNADWTQCFHIFNNVEMALVPAGCFMMGSTFQQVDNAFEQCERQRGTSQCKREWYDVETPQTRICFEKPFWIGRYEVTNAQYKECVDDGECSPPSDHIYFNSPEFTDYPVVFVDWFQADTYCKWEGGRLPRENEWEYAARGPDGLFYPWGNAFDPNSLNFCDKNCNFEYRDLSADDGYSQLAPIGSYESGMSWIGALDMVGNAWEWISDIYQAYPYNTNREGEVPAKRSSVMVLRGGSWINANQASLRATSRNGNYATNTFEYRGFRCARDFQPGDLP